MIVSTFGGMNQRPAAPELVSPQVEQELAVLDSVFVARNFNPHPFVPADRRAGPVLTVGDDTFEFRIFQGVRLHVHGQPFVRRVRGGPLRDGPRLENAVHFQAQIPVERTGVVFLDDEKALPAQRDRSSKRLRGQTRRALLAVPLELIGDSFWHA